MKRSREGTGERRLLRGLIGLLALVAVLAARATAQTPAPTRPQTLVNGDMETVDEQGKLAGWFVPKTLVDAGFEIGPTDQGAFAGQRAARIDSRSVKAAGNGFGNLIQSIDATPWRGKRVRYRAAVSVPEGGSEGGRAQMWLRVDRTSTAGTPRMGFFDNMGDRPITSAAWASYDIVGDVAEDAQSIVLGVMTLGPCVVLVDGASLEFVGSDVASTSSDEADASPERFFTPWLLLPLLALALFGLATAARGRVGGFALAFTVAYW